MEKHIIDKIGFNKFVKFFTSQPYFIWHYLKNDNSSEQEVLEFDINSFKNILEKSVQEIQTKSFYIIEKRFEEKVIKKLSKVYFIKPQSIDKKIKETEIAMTDPNIDNIIDPVFSFEYKNFQIIAQPKMYSKSKKEIIFLKISTSTKLKDILRMLFDYLVLEHKKIAIKDASLYILATKANYKKHEVDFYKTRYINTNKSGRNASKNNKYDYVLQQLEKAGQGTDAKNFSRESFSIFEILKSKRIIKKKDIFNFKSLCFYLDEIIKARKIEKITYPTERDASFFYDNPHWNLIMENINNRWLGFSGHLIKRKDIINKTSKEVLCNNSKSVFLILNETKPLIKNKQEIFSLMQQLNGKIIWYDFESLSLPISPLDHILPFQQVVFQVSLINTINLKEQDKKNILIDPKTIECYDFAKIINAIYHKNFKYVVYNQAYENTRLEEMIYILNEEKHPDIINLSKKVSEIIANTIDLQDYFICNSKKAIPKIFIPFLKGRYSIKLIEKYISNERSYLFDKFNIEEYKKLGIQNGMMAMEKANYRALGILGDYTWEKLQNDLKKYCENDVRSMIMIYYLIEDIVKNC